MNLERWRLKLDNRATDRGWRQLWYHLPALDGHLIGSELPDESGYTRTDLVAALHASGVMVRPLRTWLGMPDNDPIDDLWIDWKIVAPIVVWLSEALRQPGTREMNLGELVRIAISDGDAP